MIDEELQEKMAEYDSMEFKKFSRYALRVKAMQSLGGLIAGMVIDDVIDDLEVAELRKWLQVNRKHFNDHQMKEVFALIEHILADGKVSNEEMEDLKWLAKRMVDHHDVGDLVTIALRILEGIFHGILADRQLSDYEVKCLCDWLEDTQFLRGVYPFDETQSLVTAVLADGFIDEQERKLLMAFFSDFIDFSNSANLSKEAFNELRQKYTISGICATDPEVTFEGKSFCLTGEFKLGSRTEVAKAIDAKGGILHSAPKKNTDYLVVGSVGSECWAFAKYGRKVEKAVENRKKGYPIQIVSERDFVDALQD